MRAASTIPLRPMVVPPAATACQECAVVPGTKQAVVNPAVGTTQETSPTSDRARPDPAAVIEHLSEPFQRGERRGEGLANPSGERGLPLVVLQVVEPREVRPHHSTEDRIGDDLHDPALVLGLQSRLGGQRAGLGALDEPEIERPHDVGLRVADVVVDLGEVGDDVRGLSSGGDDVVDSRVFRRMFAE